MSSTVDRSVIFPLAAICRMMPGCGKIAMSGSWLACTLVLISELKFAVGWKLIVTPFLLAQALTTFWKSSDWLPVNPYMIEMVLLVFLLPPPPPPELRQPVVRAATATAVTAALTAVLIRICTPSGQISGQHDGTGRDAPLMGAPGAGPRNGPPP